MQFEKTVWQLYARAIGELTAIYLEHMDQKELFELAERRAVALLGQIKAILDDATLDDPACFLRIDAIVGVFAQEGISTLRHLECE